jgi:two-component system response regulator AdeR
LGHHQRLRPDLVVLDIKLSRQDRYEVLAAIRRVFGTPVIMVTALADDLDKMQALRIDADDYVVKPFNPRKSLCERRTLKKGQVITIEPFLSLGSEWANEDKE